MKTKLWDSIFYVQISALIHLLFNFHAHSIRPEGIKHFAPTIQSKKIV